MKGKVYGQKIKSICTINGWRKRYTQVPTIILKGQWLKTAGFEADNYVEVFCEGYKITLTKTTQPAASNKKSLEERVKDLDSNQRKKLADFIEKL